MSRQKSRLARESKTAELIETSVVPLKANMVQRLLRVNGNIVSLGDGTRNEVNQ